MATDTSLITGRVNPFKAASMEQFDEDGDIDMDISEGWYNFAMDDVPSPCKILYYNPASGKIMKEDHFCPSMIETAVKENVLPFLPAKILTRFRSVSKQWDRWIQGHILSHRQSFSFISTSGFFCQNPDADPTFVSLNPSSYGVPNPPLGFLPERVHIIASSHGLIACRGHDTYYICNPANQTWRQLPTPEYDHGDNSAHILIFEPSVHNIAGHYRLICIFLQEGQEAVFYETYSSETRSWSCSHPLCVESENLRFVGPGLHCKGMVNCLISKKQALSIDLKSNLYGVMALHAESLPRGTLTWIQGELFYADITNTEENDYVVKLYSGMDMKPREEVELELEPVLPGEEEFCRLLPCYEKDRLMILCGSVLYSYDVMAMMTCVLVRGVKFTAKSTFNATFVPYVNSLVRVV